MPDSLLLKGIRAQGCHGVLPEERERPQTFEVDLEMRLDLDAPGFSDDLSDTVDYAEVIEEVVSVIEGRGYALLERLATEIASCVLARPRVDSVVVTVKKLEPPVDATIGFVAARIERAR